MRLLAEENAQLQFHKKTSMNESTNLEQEIAATKAKIAGTFIWVIFLLFQNNAMFVQHPFGLVY